MKSPINDGKNVSDLSYKNVFSLYHYDKYSYKIKSEKYHVFNHKIKLMQE